LFFSFEIEEVGFAFHDDTSSQGPLCWLCDSILKAPEVVASIEILVEKKKEIAVERVVERRGEEREREHRDREKEGGKWRTIAVSVVMVTLIMRLPRRRRMWQDLGRRE
jgi:hypothetical protein